jgi:hypothetical protein
MAPRRYLTTLLTRHILSGSPSTSQDPSYEEQTPSEIDVDDVLSSQDDKDTLVKDLSTLVAEDKEAARNNMLLFALRMPAQAIWQEFFKGINYDYDGWCVTAQRKGNKANGAGYVQISYRGYSHVRSRLSLC